MKRIGVIGIPDGWSSRGLADAFARRTGFRCLIDMSRMVLDLDAGRAVFEGLELNTLDALVIKKIGAPYGPDMLDRLAMLRYLFERGLPVFSSPAKIKRVIDRLSCTVTLAAAGIPIPPTVVTEDPAEAAEAVGRFGRAVLKPLYTSKAQGMVVVQAGPDALEHVRRFRQDGNPVIYVQKMLDLPGRDLGLAFLGGRFVGCYARAADGGSWNTTTRAGGRYEPHEPSPEILELATRAQALFGLDFTCVDIAQPPGGPVVFEVSAFGGFRGLWEAGRIDAAGLYADYVLGRLDHG